RRLQDSIGIRFRLHRPCTHATLLLQRRGRLSDRSRWFRVSEMGGDPVCMSGAKPWARATPWTPDPRRTMRYRRSVPVLIGLLLGLATVRDSAAQTPGWDPADWATLV